MKYKKISVEKIPIVQRHIFKKAKKFKKVKIYIATNYLESMIEKPYPTRAEANDIYNSLEMGADGIVLAAETAIGKFPEKSVIFLNKMIKSYYKTKSFKLLFELNFYFIKHRILPPSFSNSCYYSSWLYH